MSVRDKTAEARGWFASQQQRMRSELEEVRAVHDHGPTKGDGTELHWLTMLQARLPNRYRAEKAFVIDADGNRSDQIDIVVHDRQYCPLLLDAKGAISVPAESVYAAIEVKQDLTKGYLEYAGEKIESVRRLRRTSADYQVAQGRMRTTAKPILGGIVAYQSGWAPAFGAPFRKALLGLHPEKRIDIGCALVDGAFAMQPSESKAGVDVSAADSSLVYFFVELLNRLQKIGTVPAIDYGEYESLLVERQRPGPRAKKPAILAGRARRKK